MSDINDYLQDEYPWLKGLDPVANEIVETLWKKEQHYGGSWQKRGGPGAFMMLARKWDRIENIAKESNYDIFKMLEKNSGDVEDDIKDLVGYLLLCLAKKHVEKGIPSYEEARAQKIIDSSIPQSFGYVSQEGPEALSPARPKHKPLSGG